VTVGDGCAGDVSATQTPPRARPFTRESGAWFLPAPALPESLCPPARLAV